MCGNKRLESGRRRSYFFAAQSVYVILFNTLYYIHQ